MIRDSSNWTEDQALEKIAVYSWAILKHNKIENKIGNLMKWYCRSRQVITYFCTVHCHLLGLLQCAGCFSLQLWSIDVLTLASFKNLTYNHGLSFYRDMVLGSEHVSLFEAIDRRKIKLKKINNNPLKILDVTSAGDPASCLRKPLRKYYTDATGWIKIMRKGNENNILCCISVAWQKWNAGDLLLYVINIFPLHFVRKNLKIVLQLWKKWNVHWL